MNDIIAKPSVTMAILKKYDLKATKKFGQNFLIDPNIIEKIAKAACQESATALEIGPGIGALTQFLSRYFKKVYAHEIDKKLITALNDIFQDTENIEIIPGDFLNVDFSDMPYRREKIVVCANLPYYITTPVLFKLFESDLDIQKIIVMVQKEVADRFLAGVGSEDYNALSVLTYFKYDISLLTKVKKTVFYPSPKVDSAVISFAPKKHKELDEARFSELVKNSFRQRRKTLKNNLQDTFVNIDKTISDLGFKDGVRAQELTLEDFLRLYGELYENQSLR